MRYLPNRLPSWLRTILSLCLISLLSLGLMAAAKRDSSLPQGNAITDGAALLRYALPIDNQPVRQLQGDLEDIATQLRANRRWGAINRDIAAAARILERPDDLLSSVPAEKQTQAAALLDDIKAGVNKLQAIAEARDKEGVWQQRSDVLVQIGDLEALMVPEFPFEVPAAYSNLPQLKGRATVEFTTAKGTIRAVLDGYSAPVTAGNFVDLVQRGFYNGMPITRAEEFYVVQLGDPPGPAEGFIDPKTKEYRAIPLEILVRGDNEPVYGVTLEDLGRYKEEPVLPFSAYGTMAMARPGNDPNGGSSQFFFFLFEPELTPAGLNLLDGRYSVFGYVIDGKDVLPELQVGDQIKSAKVVQGLEYLVKPTA